LNYSIHISAGWCYSAVWHAGNPAQRLTDSHRGWHGGYTTLMAMAVPRTFRPI